MSKATRQLELMPRACPSVAVRPEAAAALMESMAEAILAVALAEDRKEEPGERRTPES